ncbi:MBL fold metallo-hydrolase [Bosea sp. LjRoot9]|uniref:MBL fold metallo-hydrolase n=1 Tax=Bosea sp. LjRoot9 TaxID=3342341 RepID=UPI003ECDC950
MYDVSRRSVFMTAAGAASVFGLSRPIELIGSALAQNAAGTPKAFHKFKVGDIEVTTVYDGLWEKPHAPNFAKNASLDEVKAALIAGGLTDAYVPVPFTVTIVKVGGRTIMFDSGTGGQFPPAGQGKAGLLLESNLKAAGIDPASITTILVTHYHPDHIWGLMAKETNAQIYPNAEIIVPASEHKFWTDASVFTKLPEAAHGLPKRIQATLPTWKNVRLVEDNVEVVPGIRSVGTNGHTPGHTSYIVSSGAQQLFVTGDVTNIPALNMRHPGMNLVLDTDSAMAEASRRRIFERAVAEKAVLTGYHWGIPGAGTIAKDGAGYALVSVA